MSTTICGGDLDAASARMPRIPLRVVSSILALLSIQYAEAVFFIPSKLIFTVPEAVAMDLSYSAMLVGFTYQVVSAKGLPLADVAMLTFRVAPATATLPKNTDFMFWNEVFLPVG
jgi:hypothetical protein